MSDKSVWERWCEFNIEIRLNGDRGSVQNLRKLTNLFFERMDWLRGSLKASDYEHVIGAMFRSMDYATFSTLYIEKDVEQNPAVNSLWSRWLERSKEVQLEGHHGSVQNLKVLSDVLFQRVGWLLHNISAGDYEYVLVRLFQDMSSSVAEKIGGKLAECSVGVCANAI